MRVITATAADTNYGVDVLLLAISATERIHANHVILQALHANAGDILLGDETMTASNYGLRLKPGDVYGLDSGSGSNDVNLNSWYIRGDGVAGLKISVGQVLA